MINLIKQRGYRQATTLNIREHAESSRGDRDNFSFSTFDLDNKTLDFATFSKLMHLFLQRNKAHGVRMIGEPLEIQGLYQCVFSRPDEGCYDCYDDEEPSDPTGDYDLDAMLPLCSVTWGTWGQPLPAPGAHILTSPPNMTLVSSSDTHREYKVNWSF